MSSKKERHTSLSPATDKKLHPRENEAGANEELQSDRVENLHNSSYKSLFGKEDQLSLFLEYAPAAIAILDSEMRYVAATKRWLSDYNLGEIEIIGKSHYEVFPEIPDRWREIHKRCLNGALESCQEDAFPRLDGSVDWVKWVVGPWKQDDEICGLIMFTEVITERKLEQERLKASLNELRHKTRELEALNKELDAFSYSVSHDLRAPVKLIDGFSALLESSNAENLDEQGKNCLKNITRAVQRMDSLICDLMKLSRLTMSAINLQDVNISEISEEIIEELRRQDLDRVVNVQIDNEIKVVGDIRLLRIVMENLLRNAWKFTSKTKNAQIHVGKTRNAEDKEEIFINDNGLGFDMSREEELYLPFSRLHGDRFGGDGVGLATVQRIIFRHGGRLRAIGELGKGATFSFTLD